MVFLYMALNCIQWWDSSSEKCEVYLHGHYFHIGSDEDWMFIKCLYMCKWAYPMLDCLGEGQSKCTTCS